MNKATMDPNVFIIDEDENSVTYQTLDGEKWIIRGKCIGCGACEVGAVDVYHEEDPDNKLPIKKNYQIWTGVPVGQYGACLDVRFGVRLDIPVRPEIKDNFPECTLSGEYI